MPHGRPGRPSSHCGMNDACRQRALILLAAAQCACGDFVGPIKLGVGNEGPTAPCTEDTGLAVAGFLQGEFGDTIVTLKQGESRRLFLIPASYAMSCEPLIRSVEWTTDDKGIAAFDPASGSTAWLAARAPGSTRFGAAVTLASGRVVRAFPAHSFAPHSPIEILQVVPEAARPDRRVIVAGELDFPAPPSTASSNAYVELQIEVGGTVDMRVDWESTVNGLYANLCPGKVAPGLFCSQQAIPGNPQGDRKPITGSATLPPGAYTLVIQNKGPGAEHARYEIGVSP